MVSEIESSIVFRPSDAPQRTCLLNRRALNIFKAGLKYLNEQGSFPSMGSQPLTPLQIACLSYSATPPYQLELGAMRDSFEFEVIGSRPGFMGKASFISILTCIPDGLRIGDLSAKHVQPKPEDLPFVPKIADIVFVTKTFGPCTIESFKFKFPMLTLHTFFLHNILDKSAYFYFTRDKTKPGKGRNIAYLCSCFNCSCEGVKRNESSVNCPYCNIV